MNDRNISGALGPVTFAFDADAEDLVSYARTHLDPLCGPAGTAPDVLATLRWHEGQPPPPPRRQLVDEQGFVAVDRDLFVRQGELHWFRVDDLRDLHLRFTWLEQRLEVRGEFYHRLGNRAWSDRLRRMTLPSRARSFRRRRFTTLLSYLVYYPCWWWLECVRGLHPIHAAGIATARGVVLLAGASGVGKSTLAVALASTPGARLLSDSFVMHRGTEIHAVSEPILLDAWSRQWLGRHGGSLHPLAWEYGLGRDGYQLPAACRESGGRAALLLFPVRGAASSVRRLSAEEAWQRLSAADLIINDLRRYCAFAAVLEHMQPAGLVARREAEIRDLTAGVPSYELTLTRDTAADAAIAQVAELLGRPGPACGGEDV